MMQHFCTWDGGLSVDEFFKAATALSDRWKGINTVLPQWQWIGCKRDLRLNVVNEGYLSMEGVYRDSSEGHVLEQSVSEEGEEPSDDSTLILNDKDETHVYDFHIVYSFSYRVPVLYFRGYQSGGQTLNLKEIQKDLPCYSLTILRDSKWTFMTQEEHPYLHRPWYTLHPCGTSDWMKLLLGENQRMNDSTIDEYLPRWLSVVGQAVGLKIPLELHNKSIQDSSSCSLQTILDSRCERRAN